MIFSLLLILTTIYLLIEITSFLTRLYTTPFRVKDCCSVS